MIYSRLVGFTLCMIVLDSFSCAHIDYLALLSSYHPAREFSSSFPPRPCSLGNVKIDVCVQKRVPDVRGAGELMGLEETMIYPLKPRITALKCIMMA